MLTESREESKYLGQNKHLYTHQRQPAQNNCSWHPFFVKKVKKGKTNI